jgi:hypothetical protein
MPQAPILQETERLTSVVDKVVGFMIIVLYNLRQKRQKVQYKESLLSVHFQEVKRSGRGVDQPLPSIVEVKEGVELYLFPPFLRFTAGSHV